MRHLTDELVTWARAAGAPARAALLAAALACASPRPAVHLPPPPPPPAPQVDAGHELALAREARAEGRLDEAKRRLQLVADASPSNAEARLALAEILVAEGRDLERARILLREAQQMRGDTARLARVRGALEELEGDDRSAIVAYARALELAPDPELRLRRGLLLQRVGRLDEASSELERVLVERPDARAAREALAVAAEARGELPEAEHALAVVSALAPHDPVPVRALAAFYRRHAQAAKAAAVERALDGADAPARKLRPLLPSRR